MDKRKLIESILAYMVFCGLGLLSRFLPFAFLIFLFFGIAFPLAWAGIHHDWKMIGFTKHNLGNSLLWGTIIGTLWLSYTYFVFKDKNDVSPFLWINVIFAFPIWLLVMSPFQEFFFRSWLQPRLQSAFGNGIGLIITALAFTAWHFFPQFEGTMTSSLPLGTPIGILSSTLLGLSMGYLYQRTNNIAAPWLAHAIAGIGLVLIGRMTFLQYTP